MAKVVKPKQPEAKEVQAQPKAMTLAESRAHRASLHKPQEQKLSEEQSREEFRKFWASNKKKYGSPKNVEKALWLHLKTIGKNSPEHFQDGLNHFGLIKVK